MLLRDRVLPALRAVWQLLTYVGVGLPTLILLLPTAFWFNKSKTIKSIWIWFDRLVATVVHFTWKRTISGITGQYMNTKKRYHYQAKVIDKLAVLFGDDKDHCYRAYRWERFIKVV